MLLVTIEQLPGTSFEVLGMVRGSTIQCRHIGHDFLSGLQNLVGGEMESYTQMMDEAREIATSRMIHEAETLGADAVIGLRYMTASVAQGAAEVMAYGTAVRYA